MHTGALILCGGKSTRMGRDKATLPFGPECLLQRIVRQLADVAPAERIVVVAAAHQPLPKLPANVVITRDLHPDRGPLEGLAAGLRAAAQEIDALYVTGCDVPLLKPEFVQRMFDLLGDFEIAVPCDGEYRHPLAAVYRRSVLPAVERLLSAGKFRLQDVFDAVATREILVDELRTIDAELDSLKNLNTPENYEAALRQFTI
jgi:molybdopterin-guanine dinucleotide biosynthesis protein A